MDTIAVAHHGDESPCTRRTIQSARATPESIDLDSEKVEGRWRRRTAPRQSPPTMQVPNACYSVAAHTRHLDDDVRISDARNQQTDAIYELADLARALVCIRMFKN